MDRIIRILENRYVIFISLIGVLVLGFLARLYKIDSPIADWHSWRQVDTASVTKNFLLSGVDLLRPRYHDISAIQTGFHNPEGLRFVEFPIFNAFHLVFFKLYPSISFDTWGRLTAVIASMFSIFFVYKIGRKIIGPLGGVMAAFFFAFIPYNIYYSRVVLPEPLAVMFAVASLYLFIRYTESDSKVLLFSSSIFMALGILVKPPAAFYMLPMFYLAYKRFGIIGILRNKALLIAFDIALIPLFLWRIWMNIGTHTKGIPFFAWAFNGDGIRFRPAFWRWIFGERLGNMILGVWGLIPFSIGVLHVKDKNSYVLHWTLVGMFLYVSILATANVKHDYYQIFLIPPVALALANGTYHLISSKQYRKIVAMPLLGLSLVLMFGIGLFQVKEFYKINDDRIFEAGRATDELTPQNALVIAPHNGSTVFLYHTNRNGWPVVNNSIDNMIALGADYYVSINKGDQDTQNFKGRFKTVTESDNFILLNLHQEI